MAYEGALSKKLPNGHHRTYTGTSVYDGLFASPPRKKLGAPPITPSLPARAEDYREIFGGGSKASSIPFLDVPELSEEKVSVDVRASELDYSKVFGGGGDSSFVEVSEEPNARKKSEGEWTRAGRVSLSEASESSSSSEGNNVQSPAWAHNTFSGGKKFNMSYNKINSGNGNGGVGISQTTHIAELNAVRGYTCLIDQASTPLHRTESAKHVESRSSPNWFKSSSPEKPTENYQFGVGARRSKLPSSSSLPHNFNFGECDDREGSSSNSPTYFEEEVDTNSVAAISSAALRKAIEDAQAKIKVAKAIMERKKAGLKNDGKLSANDRLKPEESKEGSDYAPKKKKTSKLRDEVVNPLRASSKVGEVAEAEVFYDVENTIVDTPRVSGTAVNRDVENTIVDTPRVSATAVNRDVENTIVDTPRVSATTVNRDVTASVQVTEDTEVQKFVSDTIGTDQETSFYELKPSEADQAEPAEGADEEFTGVQSVDKNAGKVEIIAEQVFEKPQQIAGEHENLEEAEKTNKIQNGSIGDSESSKDGGEDTVVEQVHVFEKFTRVQSVDENARKAEIITEQVYEKPGEDENPEEAEKTNKIQTGSIEDSESSKDGGESRMEEEVFYHENEQKHMFSLTREESGEVVQAFDESDKCETSATDFPEPFNTGKLPEIRWLDCKKEENDKEQSNFHGLKYDTKRFSKRATWDRSMGPAIKEKLNGYCLGKEIAKILSHNNEPEGFSKMLEGKVPQKEENAKRQEESETSVRIGRKTWKGDYKDVMKTAFDDTSEDQTPVIKTLNGLTEADDSVEENYDEEKTDVLRIYGSSRVLELTKIGKPLEDKTESSFDKNGTSDGVEIHDNLVQRPRSEPDSQFEVIYESREHFENLEERIKESEVGISQEDEESKIESISKQEQVNSWTNLEESQCSSSFRRDEQSAMLDEKSESGTSKEKDRNSPAIVNVENDRAAIPVKESFKKEVELKKTQQRILDEAKEREKKEIEKGRIAVERAVREARERAFADARERAAAGARQKVKAEARERPIKTPSAEGNTKSAADKARESKLKAERAAVERATVEARERALEKAMSRKQNLQHKGPSFTSTSRFQHSSNGVSNSAEKPNGASSESAQRCKARSEREQRISERAEKALAEKNTRDLVAQKEQAERHRIAETLDIEVKRWSTGKERNLRALLSTLQYILGPDSGWQPIPLTEMITIAAVRKAYRKATLSVHPDKLQQRGATIQQKYICEKVFDLLKEAWNKFNVEER